MYRIRAFEPADYDRLAQMRNLVMPEPVDGATIAEEDRGCLADPASILRRFVAEDEAGRMVGAGFAEHLVGMVPGRWNVNSSAHLEFRRRGVGRLLLEEAERIAREGGATELEAWVRGEDDDSFAWAQRRGYELDRQRTESVLDLTKWDPARFAGHVERIEQSGIRFTAYPTIPQEEPLRRSQYQLEKETCVDIPAWDGEEFPSFELWQKIMDDQDAPRLFVLAQDGDRVVGFSGIYFPTIEGASAFTGYTAVLREYRGRGIALAAKLITIEACVRAGVKRMRTNNDDDNPAMLAVNQKLGYELVPGPRRMRKVL